MAKYYKYNKNPKREDFAQMMITGKYTQKEAANALGIKFSTACRWANEIPQLQYVIIRNRLVNELKSLTLEYGQNAVEVTKLISDIEKVETLITKSNGIQ